jgi:hypothetical protein
MSGKESSHGTAMACEPEVLLYLVGVSELCTVSLAIYECALTVRQI